MTNLTEQAKKQLARISVQMTGITVTQIDKSTVWFKGYRFGKYEEKFTADRTPGGQIKKNSIRFYE